MKRLFVTRKIALAMKQKRFNEKCLWSSSKESITGKVWQECVNYNSRLSSHKNSETNKLNWRKDECFHATWMQAIDWFEKKEIYIDLYHDGYYWTARIEGVDYNSNLVGMSIGESLEISKKEIVLTKSFQNALRLIK